jgi:hypothetical protein
MQAAAGNLALQPDQLVVEATWEPDTAKRRLTLAQVSALINKASSLPALRLAAITAATAAAATVASTATAAATGLRTCFIHVQRSATQVYAI